MLEKLTIVGYSDEKLTSKVGQFKVQINPETYKQQYSTQMTCSPTVNTAAVTNKFVVQNPQDLSLEFYLDATGVVPGMTDVAGEIERFQSVVYSYNGNIHSQNYLRILWGKLIFDCRLESMDIEYLLFTPAGVPLRAKLNTTFSQYSSPEKAELAARKNSPDLTHRRTVVAGDTLPLLCFHIYKNSKYYVEIARINGLNHFRNLEPGRQIFFPPLGD
ncbi:MAG TPA: LysM peptidoglycan-binding domain-containing protein [Candidatus Angelobacter sp.]|nr:LysM peptidoglycan-binding domain-containing protein [Candidatus Angelobacter sp.]